MPSIRVSQELLAELQDRRIEGERFDSTVKREFGLLPTPEELVSSRPERVATAVRERIRRAHEAGAVSEVVEDRDGYACLDLVAEPTGSMIVQFRFPADGDAVGVYVREDRQGGLLQVERIGGTDSGGTAPDGANPDGERGRRFEQFVTAFEESYERWGVGGSG